MDPNKLNPSNSIERVDYQLESSSKLAASAADADRLSSKAPVFNDGKLKVKVKINNHNKSRDQEEIEEGEIVTTPQVVMKNSNNIHQCSECSKTFQSGKALGGHMSSAHVQAGKDYIRKMKLKKSMKFKNHGENGLHNLCLICGKNFPSRKSLYGHMRCHPDRDWRGMEPPMDQSKEIISPLISAPLDDYSDDDDQSLETVYLNELAALAAAAAAAEAANVVNSKLVDFTDSLKGWTAKGRRGRKGLKPTGGPPLTAGLELLVNVANGNSFDSSESEEEEAEAMSSNSQTLYAAEVPDVNNGMINSKSKRQRTDVFPTKSKWDFPGNRKDEIQGLTVSSKSKIRPSSDNQVGPEKRDVFSVKKLKSSNGGTEDDVNGVSNCKSKFSQISEQELHPADAERRDFPVRSLKSSERRSRDESEKGKEKARKIFGGKGKDKVPKGDEIMIYGGKGISLKKQGFSGMNFNRKGIKFRATSESESTESEDKGYYLNGKHCSADDESDQSMNTDDDQLQQQHQKYSEGNQIKIMVKNKKKSGEKQYLKPVNSGPSADHQGDHDHHDASDHPMDKNTPEKHICSTCHKSFPSHQALGGHRSSHNKFRVSIYNAIDEKSSPKIHSVSPRMLEVKERSSEGAKSVENNYAYKCKICNKNFPTGQALGGHKRCHWIGGSSSSNAASPEEDSTQFSARKVLKFDLNEMPNIEDGDGKDNDNGNGHAALS